MSFFSEIRERRILPAVGVYIGACWVIVEILDRLVERYFLSPYLTDIVFWGLYSLIPAVILLAWTHGRPGKDRVTRAEKIGLPINIMVSIGLLLTVFAGRDLSATADRVTISNELGQQEEHYIAKESYRRRVAVFFFTNESGDSGLDWMQYGITELLVQDLNQNPFMVVNSPWEEANHGYYEKMLQAGYADGVGVPLNLKREMALDANRPWFVDGSIRSVNGTQGIELRVWDTETLEMLGSYDASGGDLLSVADLASERIRKILDIPPGERGLAGDLPLAETYGDSERALQLYIEGQNAVLFENDRNKSNALLDAAIEEDPKFVMAWVRKGINLWEQGDPVASREALRQAQKLDYLLPDRDQKRLKGFVYRISGEQDKLEKLLRLQTQVEDDARSHRSLARFLMITGRLEEAKRQYLAVIERDSSDLRSYIQLAILERSTGDLDAAIEYAKRYVDARPDDLEGILLMGDLLLESGERRLAREQFENAQLIEEPPVDSTLRLAQVEMRQGEWSQARALIDEAREISEGALQVSNVLDMESALELRLGRVERAIELAEEQFEFNRQVLAPVEQVFSYYVPVAQFNIMLDRLDNAEAMLGEAHEAISAPLDQFLSFIEAVLRARQHRFEQAEAALVVGVEAIERFKADYLSFQIFLASAEIVREKGNYAAAADHYQDALLGALRSPVDIGMSNGISMLFGACAQMHVRAGETELAATVLDRAFERDAGEPSLWVARAMLQEVNGNPRMALASVNYALAIWAEADPEYRNYREALALRERLTRVAN